MKSTAATSTTISVRTNHPLDRVQLWSSLKTIREKTPFVAQNAKLSPISHRYTTTTPTDDIEVYYLFKLQLALGRTVYLVTMQIPFANSVPKKMASLEIYFA